jgi:hypothetical protein
MSDSKRLQIQKKLTELLKTITIANGYSHDMANSVFRGRVLMDAEDMALMPIISVLEEAPKGIQDYPGTGNASAMSWALYISGWVKPDPLNPTDACHALMGDVKRCLAAVRFVPKPHERGLYPDAMLGGLITKLVIDGGFCRPPDEKSYGASYFILPFTLTYIEDTENP